MYSVVVLIAVVTAVVVSGQGTYDVTTAFDRCSQDPDMYSCLKVKAVGLIDRALRVDSLPISEFLSIKKDPNAKEVIPLSHGDLEASLPRDLNQKSSTLDKILMDRLSKYVESRTIQLHMPTDVFEGRKKGFKVGKKGGGLFLVFGAFGALLVQLALAAIALLAGKALLVGKVALLLAGILGVRTLLSHGHEEKHASQVVIPYSEPEIHHSSWGRSGSTSVPEAAHDIAYRGQRSYQI